MIRLLYYPAVFRRFSMQKVLLLIVLMCSCALFLKSFIGSPDVYDQIKSAEANKLNDITAKEFFGKVTKGVLEDEFCEYNSDCEAPNIQIRLRAETFQRPPFACLNDIRVFGVKDLRKGINIAVLNGDSGIVERMIPFDVSTTDEKLISFLRSFHEHSVVLVVSFGDVAEKISPDTRKLLALFGAKKINDWRHGDAYVMLGQWGLEEGDAFELSVPLSSEVVEKDSAQLQDCYSFPLGTLRNVTSEVDHGTLNRVDEAKLAEFLENSNKVSDVLLGDEWLNCGKDSPCSGDEIPMHFYSGQNKDDSPKMCVADRYVFARDLNGAGRGLNVAVIEPKSRTVVRVGHFDTYEKESTGLERFLDLIEPGHVVAAVSFDEASTMLSEMAKQILYELGSSMIDRIKFRAAWYFVGQKGINAFTPFEDLNYPTGNNWATPIKTWICVPLSLSGIKGPPMADGVRRQNIPKRHFCAKYDGHDEFCSEKQIDQPITPRPLLDKRREKDTVFNVPILVVSGISMNALRHTLSSVLSQEGINTQMVLTAYDIQYKEAADLASLFHSKPLGLNASSNYNDFLLSAISAGFSLFPKADSLIVLEEEFSLAPDFLTMFSQLQSTFSVDPTVSMIQAFNYNGFLRTSSDPSLVYRVDNQPPSFAFQLKRSFYEDKIGQRKADCCSTLHLWSLSPSVSLIPDVSRVSLSPPPPLRMNNVDSGVYQEERRCSEVESNSQLSNMEAIETKKSYLESLEMIFAQSVKTKYPTWSNCADGNYESILKNVLNGNSTSILSISYTRPSHLSKLVNCFQIYSTPRFTAGSFDRFTRFFVEGIEVLLVLVR